MTTNTFLLVGNGPFQNRGCEAILRGTVFILRQNFENISVINSNFENIRQPFVPAERNSNIIHKPIRKIKRWSTDWFIFQAIKRISSDWAQNFGYRKIREDVKRADLTLSIGGDNYSLDYGVPTGFINLDRFVLKYSPLVIWGASVGPFDKNPEFEKLILNHLKHEVTSIFVRESKSYDYLVRHGITDNLYLMSDPAFVMEPEEVATEKVGFEIQEGSLGFNLGPLMGRFIRNGSRDVLISMSVELLETVRKCSDRQIILIPHVTSAHSNDYELLRDIYQKLSQKTGIYLLPDTLNAAQTKWIISRLGCLIASRTHATIAGLSSCVPTISLAYSVKAYGINQDIFGNFDFVVAPDNFSPDEIYSKLDYSLRCDADIRKYLREKMIKVKKTAMSAGEALKQVIGTCKPKS